MRCAMCSAKVSTNAFESGMFVRLGVFYFVILVRSYVGSHDKLLVLMFVQFQNVFIRYTFKQTNRKHSFDVYLIWEYVVRCSLAFIYTQTSKAFVKKKFYSSFHLS